LAGFPASGIRLVQHPFPGPLQATLTPHPKRLTDASEGFGQYFFDYFAANTPNIREAGSQERPLGPVLP